MTALRLVALDLSTSAAGIAHTHDHHGKPRLGCRTVHTGGIDLHPKIHMVWQDVKVALQCRPDLVVVEGTFSRPGGSDAPLHMLRGVILYYLWATRTPYVDVAPKTLKVWATGSGDAPKRRTNGVDGVLEEVIATYGSLVHVATTDEADAVALLTMGAAAYGQPIAPIPERGRRALKVPRWPDLSAPFGPRR